jgi:molybdenum cofactor cytidylyltransferase
VKTLNFAAVILAGGLSSRMKEFKPLLPLGDATITDYVLSTFRSCSVDIILVTGYRQKDILAEIDQKAVTVIFNPEYEKGMFTSVQAGVRKIKDEHQAFFVLPVDIPLVRLSTVEKIKNVYINHQNNIIYPVFKGKRGHPSLIPSTLIKGILSWKKDGGLKAFLETHKELALDVLVNDSNILFDVDTLEDYRELLKKYKRI